MYNEKCINIVTLIISYAPYETHACMWASQHLPSLNCLCFVKFSWPYGQYLMESKDTFKKR